MNNKDLMLTPEDYEALGLTQEQINLFEDANAIAESLDILPDDPQMMIDAINKLPADYVSATKVLDEMAGAKPEMFKKFVTMAMLVCDVEDGPEFEPDPLLERLSAEELDKAEFEFYSMLKELPPQRKKELIELLNTATQQQKAELVDTLLKR